MDLDGYIGIIDGIQQVFKDFRGAWYLGCTTFCYLLIQIIRGKAGFNVPWVTKKFAAMNKEVKTLIIMGVFVIIGVLGIIGQKPITASTVMTGILSGLALGVGTIGTRNVVKQGLDEVKSLVKKPEAVQEPPKDQDTNKQS